MQRINLFLFALVAFSVNALAQNDKNCFNHLAVGVNVGTPGIGIDVAMPICDYVSVRTGISFIPKIKVNDIGVDISGKNADWVKYQNEYKKMKSNYQYLDDAGKKTVDEVGSYMNESLPNEILITGEASTVDYKLLFDIYPTKSSTFHFTAGFYAGNSKIVKAYTTNCQAQLNAITYFNENLANHTFTATVPDVGSEQYVFGDEIGVKVGDYLIKPNGEQASAKIKVNGIRPYLGLGFGNIVPKKHRVTFAFDLGCQFWGTPKVYVDQKEGEMHLSKDTNIEGDGGVLKIISKFAVYPTLNLRIGFRAF